MQQIPVLVLTGFLGSGKTTLVNRILQEQHGKRIAVIENEFGEVGVDNDLVLGADEEVFAMNNGCLCCTVRGDLIRILTNLGKRKDPVEMVLIETTGLADPGPVAQTFFMDEDVAHRFTLQGIVTVVDAFHIGLHFDTSPEALRQVAFADLLLVNKVDLVDQNHLAALDARMRTVNAVAPRVTARMADLPLDRLWNLPGFRLDRALQVDGAFLEVERPFEAIMGFTLGTSTRISYGEGPDLYALALIQKGARPNLDLATRSFDDDFDSSAAPFLSDDGKLTLINLSQAPGQIQILGTPGAHVWFFFEHQPDEFGLQLWVDGGSRPWESVEIFRPSHTHDDVSSVGLISDRPLDPERFHRWLQGVVLTQGADIYRSKGILSLEGSDDKHVLQGVHMVLTGGALGPWGQERRQSRMVFIGKNLDRVSLERGFQKCLV